MPTSFLISAPVSPYAWVMDAALIALGCCLIVAALWLLRGHRVDREARLAARREELAKLGEVKANEAAALLDARKQRNLTEPTRLVVGLSLLLLGYHALSYGLPAAWLPLRVPIDRLWMMVVGVVLAMGASYGVDRWVERDDNGFNS